MADAPIPPNIRAIVFDAVDTLIVPEPPVVDVYRDAGLRHACDVSAEILSQRFRVAFAFEERTDAASSWSVNEKRERERWRRIVSRAFDACPTVDRIFAELWGHFARPGSWRVIEPAEEVLSNLADRGYVLGLASNFDKRLHAIADELPALARLKLRVVSSEVGWRKPAPRFFDAVVKATGCAAREVLFIGDRRDTDYDGALAAGLQALLLDRNAPPSVRHIGSLEVL